MIVSSSRSSHDIIAEITESNVNMDQLIKFIMSPSMQKRVNRRRSLRNGRRTLTRVRLNSAP
jgi:hypothetical protein